MSEQKRKTVYTVSELTSEIKSILENRYPFIWISGEISNMARPSSGHIYFTLKDSRAQISAVIFKGQLRNLKFDLQNGLEISGFGRISLYEPRGTYQFIFEFIEPRGAGAFQLAFEQLKEKLSKEGLFDSVHKKNLPFLPKSIGVVTSKTGAVIHDINNVINRRFPDIIIEIAPVSVQGYGAEKEIAAAIKMLNRRAKTDVIIIARGGGSLEDLAAFNSEIVARAVFESGLPVISAVGHETDYTICDFVADLRAPTPSAAAEIVVPDKNELSIKIAGLSAQLAAGLKITIERKRNILKNVSARFKDPRHRIDDLMLLIEDLTQRLCRALKNRISASKTNLDWKTDKLKMNNPLKSISLLRPELNYYEEALVSSIRGQARERRLYLRELAGRLKNLNPEAVIERGYSITRTIPAGRVVSDADAVSVEQDLEIVLAKGRLTCTVKGIL